MPNSRDGELIPTDPEIERTFHRRQREAREIKQQEMANGQNNPIIQVNEEVVVNEGNMLVGDFMTPQIIQSQSSIVYPPFGQPNFRLSPMSFICFKNGHQFYGKADENPHTHVSQFLEMCQHFKYQGISDDSIKPILGLY